MKNLKFILASYIDDIYLLWHRDAREESLYPALQSLLLEVGKLLGFAHVDITILPKRTEAGNPDFRVWDGQAEVIGYIEAKKPDVKSLEHIANSEQLQRYREAFPNLILTDFLNFYLYRNGQLLRSTFIARKELFLQRIKPPVENVDDFIELMKEFLGFSQPAYATAEQLAKVLAVKTRFMRDYILQEELEQNQYMQSLKQAIENQLIKDISDEQFVDMYAQTITYGLFAARVRVNNPALFSRHSAIQYVPRSIGVLHDLFTFISAVQGLPQSMQVIVEDIVDVLRKTDIQKILHQYFTHHGKDDPIVHFYETFLAEYDPELRERRGVYYTPLPVVQYIISAIDYLLRYRFQMPDGIADQQVRLLDPAAGTITFIAEAIHKSVEYIKATYGTGLVHQHIENHILKHFYGFELMMAPYTIGHIKAGFVLEDVANYKLHDKRFPLYLTNALEMKEHPANQLFPLLSKESEEALKIKREQPILVIMGNPPYSGHSANQNEWIDRLLKEDMDGLQSYYKVDGKPLGEKNPKWLQDDYVKFLRFAQWKINQHGYGIVAMITNHSYLDNPTFRGMRQSLTKTFDEIYILNLHGNSLKKETTPDGRPDENVFDIRQGVAIGIFVKLPQEAEQDTPTKVYYRDLYGSRQAKYHWLSNHEFRPEQYEEIKPESPYYFFVPIDNTAYSQYQNWISIPELFPVHSVGIVTGRDRVTIKESSEQLWNALLTYRNADPETLKHLAGIKNSKRLEQFRRDIANPDKNKIVKILYRPFDARYTYYTGTSNGFHERPRPEVMRHMLAGENVGLVCGRQGHVVGTDKPYNLVFISENILDLNIFYRGGGVLFPLYLYSDPERRDLFGKGDESEDRKVNINPEFWKK